MGGKQAPKKKSFKKLNSQAYVCLACRVGGHLFIVAFLFLRKIEVLSHQYDLKAFSFSDLSHPHFLHLLWASTLGHALFYLPKQQKGFPWVPFWSSLMVNQYFLHILACPPCPVYGGVLADVHQGVGVAQALKEAEHEKYSVENLFYLRRSRQVLELCKLLLGLLLLWGGQFVRAQISLVLYFGFINSLLCGIGNQHSVCFSLTSAMIIIFRLGTSTLVLSQ